MRVQSTCLIDPIDFPMHFMRIRLNWLWQHSQLHFSIRFSFSRDSSWFGFWRVPTTSPNIRCSSVLVLTFQISISKSSAFWALSSVNTSSSIFSIWSCPQNVMKWSHQVQQSMDPHLPKLSSSYWSQDSITPMKSITWEINATFSSSPEKVGEGCWSADKCINQS